MTPSADGRIQAVGRHAAEHHGVHLGEIQRQAGQAGAFDRGDAVLRKQLTQHRRVLVGYGRAELRQHAAGRFRPAEIEYRCRARVPRRCRSASVRLARGDDLLDQRIDGGTAAIDHALSTDLDHVASGRMRKSAAVSAAAINSASVSERLHQKLLELGRRGRH